MNVLNKLLYLLGDEDVVNFTKYNNYSTYEEFAQNLTGESFDPNEWAELFYKAGAQFVSIFFFFI